MVEIKIPNIGESISIVVLSKWLVKNDDYVLKNQEIADIETDKATVTITSPETGRIRIVVEEGTEVKIGDTIAIVERIELDTNFNKENATKSANIKTYLKSNNNIKITPLALSFINKENIDINEIIDKTKNQRITIKFLKDKIQKKEEISNETKEIVKKPMSALRKKLSQRLVAMKNEAAMLTTFNEVDMSKVIELRNFFKQNREKYNVVPGYLAFFVRVSSIALNEFKEINSMTDGENIYYYNYINISIAVSTDRGLVAPVIRNVESKILFDIEEEIENLAQKARNNKILPDDLEGGTFSITNGGVFGSLFSTPLINPPQSAILGIHKIHDRPVVINKEIQIKPMMYLALSYDHRIIDGKESVSFLSKIKQLIEEPYFLPEIRNLDFIK